MAKMGRPEIKLDWELIRNLLRIQCTGEEIAAVVGCSYDTIERACKRENGITFADYSEQNRSTGKASLRRMQWKTAESGNPTMLIWLGKQMLDQRDKQNHEITGKDGEPLVRANELAESLIAHVVAAKSQQG